MTENQTTKPRCTYRGKPATNPFIFTKKTVFMQRLGDAVRADSRHYISGSIPLKKAPFLVGKFSTRYLVNSGRINDMRARRAGDEVARWLGWLDESTGNVQWVLFYWPGKNFCKEEKWKNPFDDRIKLTGYELVRITKQGAKQPVITWRYTREQNRYLHEQVVFTIRGKQDANVVQLIHTLSKSPGFAGVRDQVKKLWDIVRAEWKRSRASADKMPAIPKNIGYVRRLPDVGMVWSELMKAGKPKPEGG